ncbi:hypothetical protein CCACVL1_02346 [Corchorus capsularis]|uniref:Uncharacterized protein n=1 Tax=Corchorus capsularis TaxID=210143 RepID=A0A1R3K937_COCAP|nr:hypothetical protein CCACVL1_05480 [Corchorus capsularis]OMP03602.1 hypothetical protein CCACVL1_02346 [Corchorus capsularis]
MGHQFSIGGSVQMKANTQAHKRGSSTRARQHQIRQNKTAP